MKTLRFIKDKRGFSFVEVMFVSVIISVSALTLAIFTNSATEIDKKFKTRSSLLQVRSELVSYLSKQDMWALTVAGADATHNPELMCIRNSTACAAGSFPLTLLRKDGGVLINTANPSAGFTRDGVPCSTYGIGDPASNACAFRYEVMWTPICPSSGACVRPQVTIKIGLESTSTDMSMSMSAMNVQMDMLIDQPPAMPALVRNQTKVTNSQIIYPSESSIVINPLTSATSHNPVELVPFATKPSQRGGQVVYLSPTQVRYTPKADFYGIDYFPFSVRDMSTNKVSRATISVKVMTPYTWVGGAANSRSSSIENFCGKVVSGACDKTTFPAASSTSQHAHLIFNNTCSGSCNAELDTMVGYAGPASYPFIANSIELDSTYSGTVRLLNSARIGNEVGPWVKPVNVDIRGGTFDARGIASVQISAATRGTAPTPQEDYALRVRDSGRYLSPNSLELIGALYLAGPANFTHESGTIIYRNSPTRNLLFYAPGVTFNRLDLGSSDPASAAFGGIEIGAGFTLIGQLGIYPKSVNDVVANGVDPSTWSYSATPATIVANGNVTLGGTQGGSRCTGAAPRCSAAPYIELSGTGDQTLSGPMTWVSFASGAATANIPTLSSVRINKTSGNLTVSGNIAVRNNFEIASIAASNFSASRLLFNSQSCGESIFSLTADPTTNAGITFGEVYEAMGTCAAHLNLKSYRFNIGTYYHFSDANSYLHGDSLKSANILLRGDLVVDGVRSNTLLDRAVEIEFTGANPSRIRKSNNNYASVITAHLTNNKSSGVLTHLDGTIGTIADLIDNSGTLTASAGSVFYTYPHGNNAYRTTLKAPSTVFETVEIGHGTDLASDIQTKHLTVGAASSFSGLNNQGFVITVTGDLTLTKSFGALNRILITGAALQTFRFTDPALGMGFDTYDVSITKDNLHVAYQGTGRIRNLCFLTPVMKMDATSSLTMTQLAYAGALASNIEQNGAALSYGSAVTTGCAP